MRSAVSSSMVKDTFPHLTQSLNTPTPSLYLLCARQIKWFVYALKLGKQKSQKLRFKERSLQTAPPAIFENNLNALCIWMKNQPVYSRTSTTSSTHPLRISNPSSRASLLMHKGGALQIGVGTQMNIPTEHPGPHQCNRYSFYLRHNQLNLYPFSFLS